MTRKEQIKQAAYAPEHRHYTYAESDVLSFIEGAEWADLTMLDKACEWLEENCAIIWESPCNPTKVVENFRKAMKQ